MSYIDDPRFYYDRYFNNPNKVDVYSLLPFRPTNPDKHAEKYYQNTYQYGGNTEEYPLKNVYGPRPPKEPMPWDPTFTLSKTQDPSLDPYLFNPYGKGKTRDQFKPEPQQQFKPEPQQHTSDESTETNEINNNIKDAKIKNKDMLSSCLRHFLVIGCGALLFLFLFMIIIITSYISIGFYKNLKLIMTNSQNSESKNESK